MFSRNCAQNTVHFSFFRQSASGDKALWFCLYLEAKHAPSADPTWHLAVRTIGNYLGSNPSDKTTTSQTKQGKQFLFDKSGQQ